MSRAATKSKAEKGKGSQSTPNPAMQHEIIPGKFTEHDWNLVTGANEVEDFISGIVSEIVGNSLDSIYNKYLARQLIPFTVIEAKEAMLQIIEWNFLKHDSGESEESLSSEAWTTDEEPASSIIDSWGQGYIPRTAVSPSSTVASTPREIPATIPEETIADVSESIWDESTLEAHPDVSEKAEDVKPTTGKDESVKPKQPFRFKPYRGKLKSAGFSAMSETLHESEMRLKDVMTDGEVVQGDNKYGLDMPASCLSILKVQAGRPPGNKEVIYDEHGNVVSVVKIHPDKLPNHRVNVGYRVLEPEVEAEKARLEALKKGLRAPVKTRKSDSSQDHKKAAASAGGDGKFIRAQASSTQDPRLDPLPPSLVDTIELAPGVTVCEGGVLRSGPPEQHSGNERFAEIQLKGLKPVQARLAGQKIHSLTANDVLPPTEVTIKPPMNWRPPIPPIQSAH